MRKEKLTPKATITTSVQSDKGDVADDFKEGPIPSEAVGLEGPIAFVEVGVGMTVKLRPDYWMARVDVKVRLPCSPDKIAETYDKARSFVTKKVGKEVRQITGREKEDVPPKKKKVS